MKIVSTLLAFFAGLFAGFTLVKAPADKADRLPVSSSTVYFENFFLSLGRHLAVGFVKVQLAIDRAFGVRMPVFGMGITEGIDAQIAKSLESLNGKLAKLDEVEKAVATNKADLDAVTKAIDAVKLSLDESRRMQLEFKSAMRQQTRADGTPADVSDDCAKFLGSLALCSAIRQGGSFIEAEKLKNFMGIVERNLGVIAKTALTTSDIPLPTQYAAEVVELVYAYGTARRVGTVFPLGAATVKLPKLGTDTDWGLIAMSGTVTEVSPSFAWVTFTAEKFGGLIRLPTELDEDSVVAVGKFVARYAARKIAKVEDYQFFRSTGAASGVNGTAEGLTKNVVTDTMFYYNGGSSTSGKTKQTDATLADFRSLRGVPNGAVLQNGAYYVHPTYEALFVSFNTSATVMPYIRGVAGQRATLDGFPIEWVPVMPALSSSVSASLVHALFGDASFMYLAPRNGVRFDTSKEAAFTTDEILIRGIERLTVGKMATDPVAGLRNSAS